MYVHVSVVRETYGRFCGNFFLNLTYYVYTKIISLIQLNSYPLLIVLLSLNPTFTIFSKLDSVVSRREWMLSSVRSVFFFFFVSLFLCLFLTVGVL